MIDMGSEDEQDWMWIAVVGLVVVAAGGGAFFASALEPIRLWALEVGVLTTEATIIDLPGGAGLDLPRLAILVAAIGLLVAGTVFAVIKHFQQAKERRAQ